MKLRSTLSILAGAAIFVAVAVGAQLASAHSRPVRFDPPAGAVLSSAPSQVTAWFTAELRNDPNWNYLRVKDQNGARVDTGQAALSADRYQMSVPLNPGLGAGRYIVEWRAWDDEDGHILGDCYVFYVGEAAAQQAVTDRFRLDAGSSCERIDVAARDGTPVPGVTPEAEGGHGESASGDTDGIPLWGLIVGVGVGAAVGLVGGRVLTGTR